MNLQQIRTTVFHQLFRDGKIYLGFNVKYLRFQAKSGSKFSPRAYKTSVHRQKFHLQVNDQCLEFLKKDRFIFRPFTKAWKGTLEISFTIETIGTFVLDGLNWSPALAAC